MRNHLSICLITSWRFGRTLTSDAENALSVSDDQMHNNNVHTLLTIPVYHI